MHVLAAYHRADVQRKPFPFLLVPHCMKAGEIAQLSDEFPDWLTFTHGQPVAPNQKFRRSAMNLLADKTLSPAWRSFILEHIDPGSLEHAWRLYSEDFVRVYPQHLSRLGPFDGWKVGLRGRDDPARYTVLLDAQLIIHAPCPTTISSERGPHLKNPNKLHETQLFLPFHDDSPECELRILRLKKGKHANVGPRHQVAEENVETAHALPCRPGTLLSFMFGPDSYTQVTARGPSALPLRYFGVLAQLPFDLY